MQEKNYDGLLRRLRFTPLHEILLGRASGSLDREAIIARSGIPAELAGLVEQTVSRTGLHRDEKVVVARDLAEHFREGIERGRSIAELREDFGDPATAAALIRRSMIRKRSWLSRQVRLGIKLCLASLLIVVSLYLVVAVSDWRQVPNITIDHVAAMNAPIAATPMSERAWPLMREGLMISRELPAPDPDPRSGGSDLDSRRQRHTMLVNQAQEALPPWHGFGEHSRDAATQIPSEEIDAFFATIDEARDKLLEASTRRNLGFEISSRGPRDPQDRSFLGLDPLPPEPEASAPVDPLAGSVLQARFSHLGSVRSAARLLDADARQAILRGDGTRAIRDFEAILSFGEMVREPSVLIAQLVGAATDQLVYQSILDGIATRPSSFSDADLESIIAMLEGIDQTRFVIDLENERLFFEDLAQRIYTDDGEGDGRITLRGVQAMKGIGNPGGGGGAAALQFLTMPMLSRMMLSRADALELWNELFDAFAVAAVSPAWEIDRSSISMLDGQSMADLGADPMSSVRYFPLTLLIPAIDKAILVGHVGRADRDLAIAAVEVEAARRRLGKWPASLEEAEINRHPVDPMDGRNLAYGILDGRPTFWSIGPDRDEDGGAPIVARDGRAAWDRTRNEAGFGGLTGFWGIDLQPDESYDGDVVVWRGRPGPISPHAVDEGGD